MAQRIQDQMGLWYDPEWPFLRSWEFRVPNDMACYSTDFLKKTEKALVALVCTYVGCGEMAAAEVLEQENYGEY